VCRAQRGEQKRSEFGVALLYELSDSKEGEAMKLFVALLITLLLPLQAQAAFECTVSVANVLVYRDGAVNVLHSGRGDYTYMCSLNGTYGGVDTATCAMWASMLQAIKKKNGRAALYFDGSGSCATLPTYGSAPVPVYVGDVTP
jgi:5,10-methenyltetrahydromethanopterin hydrogenase